MRRALAVPVLLAVALLPAASVFASHAQTVDGKSVSFAHKGGNEWWVEVRLGGASAAQVAAVEAMDTGGSWKPLTLRSWGNWGGSFHLEEGHDVRFRARFGDGAVVESCWFTHPEGVETCEADPTPPAEGSFPASYRPGGNEWWVQVKVAADRPLAGVDARVDAGAWVALELKSWGDWAKSLRAPDGSIVEFRARAADGRVNHSGGYRWPDATPVDGGGTPPPGGFDATFRPKGNEWWVEVRVEGNEPIAGVDARIEGEEWRALSKRSWGAWAASFHVPDGSLVRFRARSLDGDTDASGLYRWPGATPVEEGPVDARWPREGSHARYFYEDREFSPGGDYSKWREVNITLSYLSGRWEASCEGWEYVRIGDWDDPDALFTSARILVKGAATLPVAPVDVAEGERVEVGLTGVCGGDFASSLVVAEPATVNTTRSGLPVEVDAWRGFDADPDCPCWHESGHWSRKTGLMLRWSWGGRSSSAGFELIGTDAPIARQDPPLQPPAPPAWPVAGSHVSYTSYGRSTDESFPYEFFANATLVHDGHEWRAVCRSTFHAYPTPLQEARVVEETREFNASPLRAPLAVRSGDRALAGGMGDCYFWIQEVVAKGKFPEDTTRSGAPYRTTVWWADEPDDVDRMGEDRDAWWDVATGLVLRWENRLEGYETWGRVTDTDAPLAPPPA